MNDNIELRAEILRCSLMLEDAIQFNVKILNGLNEKVISAIDIHFDALRKITDEVAITLINNKVEGKIANEILNKMERIISEIEHEPYNIDIDSIKRILK